MNIVCAGETLVLCAERALYWPARRTLLIADTHFGKDEIFRRAGLAIPGGVSAHDLVRISELLARHGAERLLVLGDFFHGSPSRSEEFIERFTRWLAEHARVRIDIVAGNHDRHGAIGAWSERLTWLRPPYPEPPFVFTHAACESAAGYVLSGHTHPVIRLQSMSGDRARLPVFWFGAGGAVLPAFGTFTGGAPIRPLPGDRVYAIADSQLIAL